jgi:hypothetical protein
MKFDDYLRIALLSGYWAQGYDSYQSSFLSRWVKYNPLTHHVEHIQKIYSSMIKHVPPNLQLAKLLQQCAW